MNKDAIESLLARVKAAKGPDRLFDALIQHIAFPKQRVLLDGGKAFGLGEKRPAVYGTLADIDVSGWFDEAIELTDRDGLAGLFQAPSYTASLDAIVGLIEAKLPSYLWQVKRGIECQAIIWSLETDYDDRSVPTGYAATVPALALCAAFLTAILSEQKP